MKVCACCKKEKMDGAFHKNQNRKDGLHPYCKSCRKAKASKRYEENKDKILAVCKEYRDRHPDRTHYYMCRDKGITTDDWNTMFVEQDGRCAICGLPQSESKTTFDIDHDHVTGKVRALLCRRCNVGLGCFGDDSDLMKHATKYLDKHKSL